MGMGFCQDRCDLLGQYYEFFYKYVETILKQLYSYIMLYNVIYLDITHIYI